MTFFPKPVITAPAATFTICNGASAVINSSVSGAGPFTNQWSPGWQNIIGQGTASVTVSPTLTQVYTQQATGANGCVAYNTYTVNVNYQGSGFSYPFANICTGSGSVLPNFTVGSTAGAFSSPSLTAAQLNPTTGAITSSAITAGTYVITNSVGTCSGSASSATINIVNNPLTANAGPDKTLFSGCRLILNGTYLPLTPTCTVGWYTQNGTLLNAAPSAVVYNPGIYIFSADNGTCTSVDNMNVTLNQSKVCAKKWYWSMNPSARLGCGGNNPDKTINGVLNSDRTASNDTLWITGNLTITNNKTLIIQNSLVVISPNVKILVQPGAQLKISGSMLQTCDGSKWQGMVVKGNNNVANQLFVESSILMDAPTVVKTEKAVGINLSDNLFYGGDVAVNLDRNKEFIIQNNEFNNYNIAIKTTKTNTGHSLIVGNWFYAVKTAISFDGDDHSKLILACNNFENYRDYAVYSKTTILQDQGSATLGAGNKFTGSAIPTDKIKHSGNSMKYYYDPSSPVAATGNVLTQAALYDASCVIVTARVLDNTPINKTEPALDNVGGTALTNGFDFKAFPNPFTDNLSITYSLPANSKTGELKIYEAASGKLVYVSELNSANNKIDVQLNVAQGLYICHIIADDGSSKQFKLVHIK